MDTISDSAFGKVVRFLTKSRLLPYSEEKVHDICHQYAREQPEARDEKTPLSPVGGAEEDETWGLYSVMSRASRVTRRNPWQSTLDGRSSVIRPGAMSGEDVIVVDWRGPSDSENPQNWSTAKKFLVSCEIWLLTFAIYIGSAIYTPGIPGVSEQFGVSNVAAVLGLTLFVLGYGLGLMVWSPLSELPNIGRSPIYILTLVVFVFFQFAIIYAKNFGMLLVFRFLTGFIGSPFLATGAVSMSDIWKSQARDYMIGIWGCFAVAAPVNGWIWTIWQLLWVSAFTLITGNPNYMSESEIELMQLNPKVVLFEALVRPFELCFFEPVVFLMNLYISIIYGILYIWFEAFPIVFGELHGFNPGEVGLAFLGILVSSCCIAIPAYFYWKWKYQSKYYIGNWNIKLEYQLPPACVGAILLLISIFWFGWTDNFASVYWIISTIVSMLFAISGCFIFNTIFHNLGVGWACILLGCLYMLFIPYPFVLYIFGKRVRMASMYARHDI
ncbi:major facilitator superfamily domain-containing protein [Aspergillus welwitschiae]|uniref:Major facilitator superfamily domain-containing protein n=1 Tax=Aspergillus welwitschiae TaxID=1341132 RepID=A0A3F3PMV4_9EURO|nr:major facilitator superfamily domain-containing protein [Aspergillus welwitschiae]RDH28092.1 major facilitator superfamily domain-containing protein [Aspergillus welwitschiae]